MYRTQRQPEPKGEPIAAQYYPEMFTSVEKGWRTVREVRGEERGWSQVEAAGEDGTNTNYYTLHQALIGALHKL